KPCRQARIPQLPRARRRPALVPGPPRCCAGWGGTHGNQAGRIDPEPGPKQRARNGANSVDSARSACNRQQCASTRACSVTAIAAATFFAASSAPTFGFLLRGAGTIGRFFFAWFGAHSASLGEGPISLRWGGHDPVPQFKATAELGEFLSQLPD